MISNIYNIYNIYIYIYIILYMVLTIGLILTCFEQIIAQRRVEKGKILFMGHVGDAGGYLPLNTVFPEHLNIYKMH